VLVALDDAAVGQWYRAAVDVLSGSRSRLDDLNVFPVPDGDTGTNLLLTAQAAVAELDAAGEDTGESVWAIGARGAVLGARANGARVALEATPGQLQVLRDAGVVDAGGAGLCLILDALVATVTGVEPARPPLARRETAHEHLHAHAVHDLPHQPPPGPGSEVQYLLADTDDTAVARLQERLAQLGDSLVVVGVDTPSGREWNVHVHVSDVGAAIEAGIEAGRPHRISVTPLAPVPAPAPVSGTRAIVAVVPSDGLAALFAGEGVRVVACGPDGVTEDDVLDEIVTSTASEVTVLPNDPTLVPIAGRAAVRAREAGREVGVVPTRSPVQGLAAIAVSDPDRRFGDDVIAMAEAAAATRWAEVTIAEQEALTSAGRCQPGDVLGSAEGDVVVIGADLATVGCDLLDRLLSAGGEMATLVVGPDSALGDVVCGHLSSAHPTIEVIRYDGGPEGIPLQVGVE
jgi:dihydroxyacetone kinase-like predicted kinase